MKIDCKGRRVNLQKTAVRGSVLGIAFVAAAVACFFVMQDGAMAVVFGLAAVSSFSEAYFSQCATGTSGYRLGRAVSWVLFAVMVFVIVAFVFDWV